MEREKIDAALKEHVVPVLRSMGFKGSFPHFRRNTGQQIDLLTFQFDKHGGGFVIEVAVSPTEGVTLHWGEQIPAAKVVATHLHPNKRIRLGAAMEGDHWFRYDNKGTRTTRFEDTAREVLPYLSAEATDHWAKGPLCDNSTS
ncbi:MULTISPECIES: DUF4304 domain-containing protein [unclassified Pseudomonas]|jgi:hypothetical protein|uniref:DUF4304 domain-containing protein n=1 Tax=unclassified Pseudomonas TaxID=196821 RepID=UPI001054ED67|nr:DUF4304 domain-containing protein [Pseudomonas sp. MS-1(2024)]MEC4168752.1 DUF4304 domain-containing protein [Pseudomonas sp. MS-1(2024)]